MKSTRRRLTVIGVAMPMLLGLGAGVGLAAPAATDTQVPDVVGLSEADARATLAAAGLTVGAVGKAIDWNCLYINLVMKQDPGAGTVVDAGSPVKLTLGVKPRICP